MFEYDKTKIRTTDEIKISIADLRDLVNSNLIIDQTNKTEEINLILKCIIHKNHLDKNSLRVVG